MQVTETSSEGLKREFKVVVARSDIERLMAEKLHQLSQRVRLPGFRPGKVPVKLLKQQYGRSVMSEVVEEQVNAAARQAIADHALRPALQPRVEVTRFEEGTDLECNVAIEVLPDVTIGDFTDIALERLVASVSDERVDDALQRLASQQKTFQPLAEPRPAATGDAVLIDFVGKVDGVAFEGGSATGHQLVLGSGSFIPGFEDQLVGAGAGEARDVRVTFPADYGNKDLAGKDALFEVTLTEVREAPVVAIDDELAKRLGLDDLEALKEAIRQQLKQEYASYTRRKLKRGLLDRLAERYDFPVPPGMVDVEFEQIWRQVVEAEGGQAAPAQPQEGAEGGADAAAGAVAAPATDPAADPADAARREEYRRIAERRVRLGLLLAEVGRANNIEVQAEEVTRAMLEQARRFPGQERKVIDYFQKNPDAMAQLRAPIYEEKVVDFIVELAQVTERDVSPEELTRDAEEDENEILPQAPAEKAEE